MLVVNTIPFDLVYTLVNHPQLGLILEPHVVQINTLGKFTLTHQRIYLKTSDYFSKQIKPQDVEIIKVLDTISDESLYKKFYIADKKKYRVSDFLPKNKNNEELLLTIRNYVDEKLNIALNLLRGKIIYKMGNDNNPTSQKINVSTEKGSVLFHFRKNDEGTRYFPTIKHAGQRIDFMYKGALIICNNPAWLLLNDTIFDFVKEVDGKKLQPFLNKRYIQIAKSAEETYFSKFVVGLIEKYDVYAEGFEIISQQLPAQAILQVLQFENKDLSVKLAFQYGNNRFDFDTFQPVNAMVKKEGNHYTFIRYKRNLNWENEQKLQIEKLGLIQTNGSFFSINNTINSAISDELITSENSNKYDILEWLNENTETLRQLNITVEQVDDLNKYYIGTRQIKLEINEQKDWFDIKAIVQFGNYSFNFLALKEHILKGKREFLLPNGQIAVIPNEWFGNLNNMLSFSTADEEIKLEKHHIGLLEELQHQGGKYLRISDKLEKIKAYGQIRDVEEPVGFNGKLRPYQKAGYNWFYFLKQNQFGGCLADDMGLGKTIQTLALLQKEKELYHITKSLVKVEKQQEVFSYTEPATQLDLFATFNNNSIEKDINTSLFTEPKNQVEENMRTYIKTSLIVVPNSLVYNWYNEARKFTPELKILIYTGSNREKNSALFQLYDLVISTYGTVRVDIELLKTFKFNYIILDESQSIKNPNSLSSRATKLLVASNRLVLTGTPIENTVSELWSQLSFINPGLLGSIQSFNERFVAPIERAKDNNKMLQLKAIIKPFVLRRTKDQVATELPPKIEQIVYNNMTEQQAEAYETVKSYYRNEIIKSISEIGFNRSQLTILQGLTKLRQIANHPIMVNPEYDGQSGKFDELIARAETAKQEGHKVLIFSQFVKQLDIYKKHFDKQNWNYCYLDGSMPIEQRQEEVKRFQMDSKINYFLISLKAGGVGLNLTQADYVFIIDPWWNPAVEQQAIDRSHRIGQTKTVFTYKFITKDTVEEKILAMQQKKKELAENIITNEESFIKNIDVESIIELLS